MAQRHVDKVACTQLLEAAKGVIDHLSRWLIESGHGGAQQGLSSLYAQVRRLKDYLQRGVAAYPSRVLLDLSEQDENLLAACAVHHLGDVEGELRGAPPTPQQRAWLESKVKSLAAVAVELATTRVARIPVPASRHDDPPAVREALAAIARKAVDVETRMERVESALVPATSEPRRGPADPFGGLTPEPPEEAVRPVLALRPDPEAATGEPALLDPRSVRDPRLRAMIAMDQKAFAHAKAAGHLRLAMVLLSSILEGIVVDYAVPRRRDLGIAGSPETWRIDEIVAGVMGERITVRDRPCLVQLVAARNLVRPAVQLASPMAVTGAGLQQNEAFVRRVMTELGFVGSGE